MSNAREQSLADAEEAVRSARRHLEEEVRGVQRLTGQVGVRPRGPWVRLLAAAGAGLGAALAIKGLLGRRGP